MSVTEESSRYGIARPQLEYYEYSKNNELIVSLTPASDRAWAQYLQQISSLKRFLHIQSK